VYNVGGFSQRKQYNRAAAAAKLTVVKKDEGFVHMRDTPKAGMVQIIDYIMIDLQVQKEVVVM